MAARATWTDLLDLPGLENQDKHKFKVDLWTYLDARFLGLTQANKLTDKQIREIANDFMFDEEGQTIWEPAQQGLWNFAKYDLNDIQAGIAAILFRLIEEHDPTTDLTIVSDADPYNTIKTPSKRSQHETPSSNKRKKHLLQKTSSTDPRLGAAGPSNVQRDTSTTSPLTPSKKSRPAITEDIDKLNERNNITASVPRGIHPGRNLREDTVDSIISIPHDPPPRVIANDRPSRNIPKSFTSANASHNPASTIGFRVYSGNSTIVAANNATNDSIGSAPMETGPRETSNTHGVTSLTSPLATSSSDGENQARDPSPEQVPPSSRSITQISTHQLAQTTLRLRDRIFTVRDLAKIPSTVIDYLNECRNAHLLSANACQDEDKQQWHHSMAQHVIQLKDDLESRFDSLAVPGPLSGTQLVVSNNFLRNAQM